MPKSSISDLRKQKDTRAKEKAQKEAQAAASGKDPWERETRDDRLSMRIEESLLEAFDEKLPRHMRRTDGVRELMIRVAKDEITL